MLNVVKREEMTVKVGFLSYAVTFEEGRVRSIGPVEYRPPREAPAGGDPGYVEKQGILIPMVNAELLAMVAAGLREVMDEIGDRRDACAAHGFTRGRYEIDCPDCRRERVAAEKPPLPADPVEAVVQVMERPAAVKAEKDDFPL
jgi:hypothetical protein